MKRATLLFVLLSTFVVLGHASAKLHFAEAATVFNGYGDDDDFKQLLPVVSDGIENITK
jgi:hypothetical protein